MPDRLFFAALLLCFSSAVLATTTAPTPKPDVEALIREGVALFDAGDLAGARAKLEAALAVEPANVMALYELSYTHMAARSLEPCLATTAAGLAIDSPYRPGFFTMRGSCLSDAGRLDEALAAFRDGLRIAANDPMLNYNIAITLLRKGDESAAADHLERTLLAKPDHRSALLTLGSLRHEAGRKAPSVAILLRFLMVEPEGSRAQQAATALLADYESTVTKTGEGKYTMSVPAGEDKDATLGMALAISAAAMTVVSPDIPLKTEAKKRVDGLGSFVAMVGEGDSREVAANLWKIAFEPLVALEKAGLWEPFGYRVLAASGSEEAAAWLAAHPAEVGKLREYLQPAR